MVSTYGELYHSVRQALVPVEGPMASNTARELLSHVSGVQQAALMAMQSCPMPQEMAQAYLRAAERILANEPLAYVLGQWDFGGLRLTVTPDVLIPRDDTMEVVELALSQPLPDNPRILDLCTGSGCIGLKLASVLPDARVTLADLSMKALKVARKNASDLRLSGRVSCVQADAMQPASKFLGQFDLIVSNPPYIVSAELAQLQSSVRDYEPAMALDGGEDGLDFYRAIAKNFTPALKPGGLLAMEFGLGQADDICTILEHHDYEILQLRVDTGRITRAVLAKKKERNQNNGEEEGKL